MRTRLSCLAAVSLLFLAASASVADTIAFDPPAATVNHSVDAIVSGLWNDGCVPPAKNVAISGSTITLTLDANVLPDIGCTSAVTPYTTIFHLGILPAGSYTVVTVSETAGVSTERGRATLIVREPETMTIIPYAVPLRGGQITINSPFLHQDGMMTIDGIPVSTHIGGDIPPWAIAPPHAAGAADVTIDTGSGTVTSKAALIYYDPAAADPAVFEPILFPVSFQGPGALGSQWVTENFISANGPAYFRDPLPCASCTQSAGINPVPLTNNSNPWGHVLYALRGTTDTLNLASRIRETSRQAQTAGTDVPVVRERDFRSSLRFMNLPVDSRYRVMLRLWAIGDGPFGNDPGFTAALPVSLVSTPVPFLPIPMTKIPDTAMWFGTIDVTSLLTRTPSNPNTLQVYSNGYGSATVPLAFPRVWGMLSITNNDTQQVTIVSPH
ncbi:MAG: hypothetical protein WB973_03805 [Thermoanaerobaculia bacterium]